MKLLQKLFFFLLIGLIILGIRFYLNEEFPANKDNTEGIEQSANWLYRKAIDIENKEGINLYESETMITINTEELINSKKLLENCNDIRFLDSDNITSLEYWIEDGCNTNTTKIWIRLPVLPKEGTVVYFYYGNPEAPNIEERLSDIII